MYYKCLVRLGDSCRQSEGATREWSPNLCLRDRDQPGSWPRYPPHSPDGAAAWSQPGPDRLWPCPPVAPLAAPGAKRSRSGPSRGKRRVHNPHPRKPNVGALWTRHAAGTLHPERRAVTQGRTPPGPPPRLASPRRPHLPRALERQASEFSALKGKAGTVAGQWWFDNLVQPNADLPLGTHSVLPLSRPPLDPPLRKGARAQAERQVHFVYSPDEPALEDRHLFPTQRPTNNTRPAPPPPLPAFCSLARNFFRIVSWEIHSG